MSPLWGSPGLDFMDISASAPDAPPLSETTIGCFIKLFFWIAACIIRAIWSEAPPAPAATTISTGLGGSPPAKARLLASTARNAAAAAGARRPHDLDRLGRLPAGKGRAAGEHGRHRGRRCHHLPHAFRPST